MTAPDAIRNEADLTFLRDEGLRVLAAYRRIPDAGIRKSILALIENVTKDPSADPFGIRAFQSENKQ